MTKDKTYNGWANYETWNCAVWIGSDEGLYNIAKQHKRWDDLADELIEDLSMPTTPDHVAWDLPCLDRTELNSMLEEL